SVPIYEKCSAAWQSIRSIAAILPRPIPTLDSVVCNDSTFGQEKQENDKSARIPTLFNFFSNAKETVEPPGSQSYNANTS
ncbi:MAG: hypothetical protein KHW95_05305, partial [Firmicutes bacterium]|nr:hypothetical protein [Bacillota bacterium]